MNPVKSARNRYLSAIVTLMDELGTYDVPARAISNVLQISVRSVYDYLKNHPDVLRDAQEAHEIKRGVITNKKISTIHSWRDVAQEIKRRQSFNQESSWCQENSEIHIITNEPIKVIFIADLHIGSWGTNYETLEKLTDEILAEDGLYVVLLGDLAQHAINIRQGITALLDAVITPEQQTEMVTSWFEEIKHKILFATWDNHSIVRHEIAIGESPIKSLLKKSVMYHNGIARAIIKVGSKENPQIYTMCCSHKFRGRSYLNPVHAAQRHGRFQDQDADILVSADTHVPGVMQYYDGNTLKTAMNCGTLQSNSEYTKRYFSLWSRPDMPVLILCHNCKEVIPFVSMEQYKAFVNFFRVS